MIEDCKHEWKQEYYGIRCAKCDLFYPDNSNWFAPLDDEEEEYHSYDCTCEECLQNHPERDILYGDGNYFNWGNEKADGMSAIDQMVNPDSGSSAGRHRN